MDRLSFYRKMIMEKLDEIRGSLGETRYGIYREIVMKSSDFEELRDIAELELQIDMVKYVESIKESLKAQGVTIEGLRRAKGEKLPEDVFFVEVEKNSLTEDLRGIRESADGSSVSIADMEGELEGEFYSTEELKNAEVGEEEEYDFEIVDEDALEGEEEEYDFDEDASDDEESEEDEDEFDFEVEDEDALEGEPEEGYDFEIEDEDGLEDEDEEFEIEDDEGDIDFEIEDEDALEGEPEEGFEDPVAELSRLNEGIGFNERPKSEYRRESSLSRDSYNDIPSRIEDKPVKKEKVKEAVFNTQTEKGKKNQDMMDFFHKGLRVTAKQAVKTSGKFGESIGKLKDKPFFKLDSEDDDDEPIKFT